MLYDVRMTEAAQTVAPAFDVLPHLRDPSGVVAVWYTEPPGVVLQMVVPSEGTVELAQWLVGPSRTELERRFSDAVELVLIMDLRLMTGRDPRARSLVIELAKALKPRAQRFIVIPPRAFSPTLRRTMEVTVALLRVFGVKIELAQSLTFVLASTGLKPLNSASPKLS